MSENNQENASQSVTQEQIDIINKAADSLLVAEKNKAEAREVMVATEKGQLATLTETLGDFPGVVSEAVWDSSYKPRVAERLKDSPSKATLLNRLKRVTMGLTLAKEDPSFAPLQEHTNLKKYADWVGVKLQNANDPATGKPRLKSIAKPVEAKAPKLREGQTFWLLGAAGDEAYPSVTLGPYADFDAVKAVAKLRRGDFKRFWFIIGSQTQLLDIPSDEDMREVHQNAARQPSRPSQPDRI